MTEFISYSYPKINTLYKRDLQNQIILDEYCNPIYKMLKNIQWEATEKIDGINIRINLLFDQNGFVDYKLQGRNDNSNIPVHLVERLDNIIKSIKSFECFNYNGIYPDQVILYGEGYGNKILKGKNYIDDTYESDCDFILFDIKIGNYFLERNTCEEIANSLGLRIVPFLGYMTIGGAIQFVQHGFQSFITKNDMLAEGVVLKPRYPLYDKLGNRIITKIKHKDFKHFS